MRGFISAPPATKGWKTAFEHDLGAMGDTSWNSNGTVAIGGINVVLENMVNANSIALVSNVGLRIDCNANYSLTDQAGHTSPSVIMPITNALPTYDATRHKLRFWFTLERANQSGSETIKAGFARYPFVDTAIRRFFHSWAKQATQEWSNRIFSNATTDSSLLTVDNTFFQIVFNDEYNIDFYACGGATSSTFDSIAGTLVKVWSLQASPLGFTRVDSTHKLQKSSDYALMFCAMTLNNEGNLDAIMRRWRLDYLDI